MIKVCLNSKWKAGPVYNRAPLYFRSILGNRNNRLKRKFCISKEKYEYRDSAANEKENRGAAVAAPLFAVQAPFTMRM